MAGCQRTMGRESRHHRVYILMAAAFAAAMQALQGRGQRTVAHRRAIGKAAAQQGVTCRPGADAMERGEFLFRRRGRTIGHTFYIQIAARHSRGRTDQIIGLGTGIAPPRQHRRAEIGHAGRSGVRAHTVTDIFTSEIDDFPPERTGEFHIDLLTDDGPAQAIEPGGRGRNTQTLAPRKQRHGRIARHAGFEGRRFLQQAQHAQRSTMQKRHGVTAKFRARMHMAPGAITFKRDFEDGRTIIGQQRLPDAIALASLARALGIAGVIGQHLLRAIAGG